MSAGVLALLRATPARLAELSYAERMAEHERGHLRQVARLLA